MSHVSFRGAVALCALAATGGANAHGGHPVPVGISPLEHLHVFDTVVGAGPWIGLLVLGALLLGGVAITRRRRAGRVPGHRRG